VSPPPAPSAKKQTAPPPEPDTATVPNTRPGGGVAMPGSKKRRTRETPPDDGTGEPPTDDTPVPRKAVASEAGGGDCSITVNSVPWSEVWIDGKNTSQHTPVVDYKLPCGKHKLSFKRPDMQIDQTEPITVKSGQNFKQRYTLATDD
jgi:hypothetical protein